MDEYFTSKTYGKIPYTTENGKYEYLCTAIAAAIGCPDNRFSSHTYSFLLRKGYARLDRRLQRKFIDLQGVEYVSRHIMMKGGRRENARLIYEWLKGQEESARNGAPCTPEPVKTEQPTKSKNCLSKFDATFDAFTAMMSGEIEKRQQMLEACNGLRDGALKYKEMYNAEKAQNATLQAQVAELIKLRVDANLVAKLRKELARVLVVLGKARIELINTRRGVYNLEKVAFTKDAYTPTDIYNFITTYGLCEGCKSGQDVNKKIVEAGYQVRNDTDDKPSYKLTDLLDDSYAYVAAAPSRSGNGKVVPTLQWTENGIKLFIGLWYSTEIEEQTLPKVER